MGLVVIIIIIIIIIIAIIIAIIITTVFTPSTFIHTPNNMESDERWNRISVEDMPTQTPFTEMIAGSLTNVTVSEI